MEKFNGIINGKAYNDMESFMADLKNINADGGYSVSVTTSDYDGDNMHYVSGFSASTCKAYECEKEAEDKTGDIDYAQYIPNLDVIEKCVKDGDDLSEFYNALDANIENASGLCDACKRKLWEKMLDFCKLFFQARHDSEDRSNAMSAECDALMERVSELKGRVDAERKLRRVYDRIEAYANKMTEITNRTNQNGDEEKVSEKKDQHVSLQINDVNQWIYDMTKCFYDLFGM